MKLYDWLHDVKWFSSKCICRRQRQPNKMLRHCATSVTLYNLKVIVHDEIKHLIGLVLTVYIHNISDLSRQYKDSPTITMIHPT